MKKKVMDADLIKYLAELMPNMERIDCSGCPGKVAASAMVERDGKIFCSETCADKKLARMIHPQPKRALVDGWDV